MAFFDYALRTKIIFGEGKSKRISDEVKVRSISNRAVIVTDEALAALGLVDPIVTELEKNGVETKIYDDVKNEPSIKNIDDVSQLLQQFECDCVIGIGGGSPLDVAKTASLSANGTESVESYALGARPFPEKHICCITIPTTAGTGAEVTSTTVFSSIDKRKLWAWDAKMAPEVAILDPLLTIKLPPLLTAATGIDAIVHAIEACTGQNHNPMIEATSLHAIRLISQNIQKVLKTPNDIEARGNLLIGATLGGIAIEHGGTGLAHCIGHALGSVGGLPHGKAVAVALYHVYEWNVNHAPDKTKTFAEIARALGVTGEYHAIKALALQGVTAFRKLVDDTSLSLNLMHEGFSASDVNRLYDSLTSDENAPMKKNNCYIPSENDLKNFAFQVLSGTY